MDTEILKKAIMNITGELDKLSAFTHLDRKELNGEENEPEAEDSMKSMFEKDGIPMDDEGSESPEEECSECESSGSDGEMQKKPLKFSILSIKKGKKGAFG
jgi:hypothetical protein